MEKRYNNYSDFLINTYGEKVYKLPINLDVTCPNRDGTLGVGGCTFCGDDGAGHEKTKGITVVEQLKNNMEYIGKKYNAKKFIAYFQNYSNTYLDPINFKKFMEDAVIENIVEIAVSTRPDCITIEHLNILNKIKIDNNINITIELGLQTVNYKSLKKINRGHTLPEFVTAMMMISKFDFFTCVHIILNLPWDDMEDTIECAKFVSAFQVNFVKLHSLYIVKGTKMEEQFLNNEFIIGDKQEYINRCVNFLRYSNKNIKFQRLIGRAPKEITSFSNWETSWWKIKDEIEALLEMENAMQGDMIKKDIITFVEK